MPSLPTFNLGWQLVDPGPAPVSARMDDVPVIDDRAQLVRIHEEWKQRCLAENRRLEQHHDSTSVVWHPVPRADGHAVVPFFGGSQETWAAAVITLTAGMVRSGYGMVRIVNLSGLDVISRFHRLSPQSRWASTADVVAPNGTTIDVFKAADADQLANVITDVLRTTADAQGRLDAVQAKQLLVEVAAELEGTVTFERLAKAVGFALAGRPPAGSSFSVGERTRLLDFHVQQVSQRQLLRDGLDRLKAHLEALLQFRHVAGHPTKRYGLGPLRAATVEVTSSGSRTQFEWGREVLAHQVARTLERPRRTDPGAFIVLGADELAPHVLSGMLSAANREGHQLLLFFQRILPRVDEVIGKGAPPHAVFFGLAHPDDREWAAKFLGEEFKFVVNGYSISAGRSEDWSTGTTISSDRSVTRTRDFGQLLGGSASRAFGSGQSRSSTSGRGQTFGITKDHQRVKEYVLEPELFRDIPECDMLIVDGRQVTHARCEPKIRSLPITSTASLVLS